MGKIRSLGSGGQFLHVERDPRERDLERDEKVVGVPEDARATELAQQIDALPGLRPALGDVAQRDDQVDVVTFDVGERGAESDGVRVHVGEEGDPHSAELTDTP